MSFWRSIELRLTVWYAVVLCASFLLLGVVLWLAVRYPVRVAIDDRLQDRVDRLVSRVSLEVRDEKLEAIPAEIEEELVEYAAALPESHLSQIRDGAGRQLVPAHGRKAAPIQWRYDAGRHLYTEHVGTRSYRVLVQRIFIADRPYTVLVAGSLEILGDIGDRIAASLLVLTPIALLACCGGGLHEVRSALRPVDETAETASESEPWNANASQELRAPLAAIQTTAELALRHGRTEAGYRSNLKDIQSEAEYLSDLIEMLLPSARDGERPISMSDTLSPSRTENRAEGP